MHIYGWVCLYIVRLTLHSGVGVVGVHLLVSWNAYIPSTIGCILVYIH